MSITPHPNADAGAEADQFRDSLSQYETTVTLDEHDNPSNTTTIEYISGEGDPPFIKYRLTLTPISMHSEDEYAELKAQALAKAAE